MTWGQILQRWSLVEADLHERYGIDVDSPIMRGRSWRWLRVRVFGLLSVDSRLARALQPRKAG
ncbi:MAG TPA: hypothetical protein VIQ30_22680 [Pseudonocardia sp.]